MPTRRQARINELLLEALVMLVPGQLDDPRVQDARVTRVEATQDLSTAKVYVIGAEDEAASQAMLAGLHHAEGALRVELADLGLRRLPHLVFARDTAYESGQRVVAILDALEIPPPADEAGESTAPSAL